MRYSYRHRYTVLLWGTHQWGPEAMLHSIFKLPRMPESYFSVPISLLSVYERCLSVTQHHLFIDQWRPPFHQALLPTLNFVNNHPLTQAKAINSSNSMAAYLL